MDEVLLVAVAVRCVLHPLDICVDRFAGRIPNPVSQIGDDPGPQRCQPYIWSDAY